jgi:hypothetical protein
MMRKTMMLFLSTLVVASMVGVGYAHWSDYVQIEGTVHMGELIFGILNNSVTCWDNEPGLPIPKDVAECWVNLTNPETSVHHVPTQTVYHDMLITVNNSYPCYEQWIQFALKNAGTIPVHIVNVTIWGMDLKDNQTLTYDPVAGGFIDPVQGLIINFNFTKLASGDPVAPCQQIHPCTEEWVQIYLHFKQEAEECHTYWFKIHIDVVQWNLA